MNTVLRRIALLAICALLFGCGSSAASDCSAFEKEYIVSIDETNSRIFVIASEIDIENIAKARELIQDLRDYVRACQNNWSRDWSTSVFSDKELAGYKDDPNILEHVTRGRWAAGYLAEFSESSGTLTRYPMLPERRDEILIR